MGVDADANFIERRCRSLHVMNMHVSDLLNMHVCHVEDYVSAPFRIDKMPIYKDGDSADKFFRPALRSLLV